MGAVGVQLGMIISIHAPREGGDYRDKSKADRKRSISIHAPREGGDPWATAWS